MHSVGWRSIFWVTIPVGLATVVLTACFVPESRGSGARRPDPVGQLVVMVALAGLTYGIIEGPRHSWASPLILLLFLLSFTSLALLVAYERRRSEPLIELRFFASAPFSGATVVGVVSFAGLGGFLFSNTLYLQDVRHLSAPAAALDTLPVPVTMVLGAPVSGRLVGRVGTRPSVALGGAGIALGTFLHSGLQPSTRFSRLALAYIVFGVGVGLVNTPLATTRGLRHARQPGRCRWRGGLDQPAGGSVPRRRRHRCDLRRGARRRPARRGVRRCQPPGLARPHRLRGVDPRARSGHDHALGPPDGPPYCRAVRARGPAGTESPAQRSSSSERATCDMRR